MPTPTDTRLMPVQQACREVLAAHPLAGLVVTVVYDQAPPETLIFGADERGVPLTPDSLFPVASITKLAVALCFLRLWDQGRLSVHDPLAQYVPEAQAARHGVTLRQLITHTAGLAEMEVTYNEQHSWPIGRQACLAAEVVTPPGTRVNYVNSGYGLLGIVLERILDMTLHEAINTLVAGPLGVECYLGVEPPRTPITLFDPADQNAGTPLEAWNTPYFRSLGEPWTGLYTTPAGALRIFRAFLGVPAGFLRPATQQAAIQDQTGGVGGGFAWQTWDHCPWGLGPALIAPGMQHWSFPNANAGTICSGGYSGCGVFADPSTSVTWSIHGTRSAADPWFTSGMPLISQAVLASAA